MDPVTVALVSLAPVAAAARATVRTARAAGLVPVVLDVDGSYRPLGDERVLSPADLGHDPADLHRRLVAHGQAGLRRWLHPDLVVRAGAGGVLVLAVEPGIHLLDVESLVEQGQRGLAVLPRSATAAPDDRWPDDAEITAAGAHHAGLIAVRRPSLELLETWRSAVDDRWLDLAVSRVPHTRVAAPLVSPWSLGPEQRVTMSGDGAVLVDGVRAVALDLTGLDPQRPWLLTDPPREPRGRLSDHPVLARWCERAAAELAADAPTDAPGGTTALGSPVDDLLVELYRRAERDGLEAPDPLDPTAAEALADWLGAPVDGGPGRYLRALYRSRPDVRAAYPGVPGDHTDDFLRWVQRSATTEGHYPPELLAACLERTPPAPPRWSVRRRRRGVNVVGFLGGGLGIGESARLLTTALDAAGIPTSTVAVEEHLASERGLAHPAGSTAESLDTTVLCVNADLTPTVAAAVPRLLSSGYRVGMWYWEVESFPAELARAADLLDEVWVATDFVRAAIAPQVGVPVRVVTPPLPQAGPEPRLDRAELDLPEDPVLLFSFDYLSTAERKNAAGLVTAFTRAVGPHDGPLLVIKSINAHLRPAQAERLRLLVAALPQVRLVDGFWPTERRDALVAHADAYVSLHRSEGLGLTMAEAMAWGRPVIATGYSGNLQFMTQQNSFLVPSTPVPIPEGAEPYPAGTPWADPDLTEAARLIRLVLDDPAEAHRRGAQAARDIATLHSPQAAGARVAAALTALHAHRPRRRTGRLEQLGRTAVARLR